MSDEMTADRISVEFVLDSQKFEKGIDEIDKSLDDVTKDLEDCEGETKRAERELSALGNESKRAANEMDKQGTATQEAARNTEQLGTATQTAAKKLQDEGTAAGQAANSTKTASEQTKGLKTEMETAKEVADKFNKVLGVLGVAFSLSALIGQVKEFAEEVKKARDEYDSLYNKIYFSAGSLTDDQKKIADTLGKEFGSKYNEAISNAIGGISTFFPNIDAAQLEAISKELVVMQKRGFGDVAGMVNGLNDVVKKYKLQTSDIQGLLSYLSGTAMDTGESVQTLLSSIAEADEMAKILNKSVIDMANMFGDAKASGNAGDVQGLASKFETLFSQKVDETMKKLQEDGDKQLTSAETLQQATEQVTKLFQETNLKAAGAKTQTEASQAWSDALGIEVGRISNMLADMSMANAGNEYPISYDQRNSALSGKTLSDLDELRKTSADIDAQIKAESEFQKQEFLSSDFAIRRSETALNATRKGGDAAGWLAGRAVEVQQVDKDTGILSILEPLSFLSGIIPALAPLGFMATALKEGSNMVVNDANEVSQDQQQQKDNVSELEAASKKLEEQTDALSKTVERLEDLPALDKTLNPEGITNTTDSVVPLDNELERVQENLENINTTSEELNELVLSSNIPAAEAEAQSARNLANAWDEARRAKEAYKNAG